MNVIARKITAKGNMSNYVVAALAVVCVVLPLDLSQLTFALVGAVAFSILQSLQSSGAKHHKRPPKVPCAAPSHKLQTQKQPNLQQKQKWEKSRQVRPPTAVPSLSRPEVRKPSAVPVQAPTFQSLEWENQIAELLNQIAPSIEDDKIVGKLACLVKQAIKPMIPEIEVVGFASGDLTRKKAFGVAVPDVDVVVNVNPIVLAERLGGRHEAFNNGKLDPKKLQKSAIRACTDRLVSVGGFKFRRSAFRGEEPKVTLLAPASFGICNDAIPIDFSVNAVSPLHNAALLTECGHMEPRARELILLVKRWAKDRGIAHAAKGHLSPYAWSLLCIFFLQAGLPDDETLLPSLDGFKSASRLAKRTVEEKTVVPPTGSNKNTSRLFADFMNFYDQVFEWKSEAICVRSGNRGKPGLALPLHIIVEDDGKTTVIGPSIEDPFDEAHNLGGGMTAASLNRLKEEFSRAHNTCSKGNSSLAELLEPWAPPEQESEGREDEATKTDARRTPSPTSDAPWRKQS